MTKKGIPSADTKIIHIDGEEKTIFCPDKNTSSWNSHPKVYLQLGNLKKVTCPYCGTTFIVD